MPALVIFRAGEIFLPLLLAYWFGRSTAMDVYFFAWAVFAFAGSLGRQRHHPSRSVMRASAWG